MSQRLVAWDRRKEDHECENFNIKGTWSRTDPSSRCQHVLQNVKQNLSKVRGYFSSNHIDQVLTAENSTELKDIHEPEILLLQQEHSKIPDYSVAILGKRR